jgi:hypothetical protein
MKTEAFILSEVMDKTRRLTETYLELLKNVDLHQVFEVEGKQLNSVFWIMAHLAVTENYLLLRSTGGDMKKISWARQFGIGTTPPAPADCPPLQEVRETLTAVHQAAVAHVASINDQSLDDINSTSFEFDGEKTIRSVIVHAIRHEGTHAGHLGWLCKLHSIKTI